MTFTLIDTWAERTYTYENRHPRSHWLVATEYLESLSDRPTAAGRLLVIAGEESVQCYRVIVIRPGANTELMAVPQAVERP